MSDSPAPNGTQGGNFGWLWMLLVAGLAFGGGIYFAKPRRVVPITEEERQPPRPLPLPSANSAPALTNAGGLLSAPGAIALTSTPPAVVARPEKLYTNYNGIIHRGDQWPPPNAYREGEIMDLPYLREPPPVVDISIGRQLFVDDFLIQSMTNLTRRYHRAELFTNNPVLKPDQPWEQGDAQWLAMPDSDGVCWDPTNYHFKLWYRTGRSNTTALAVSTNGTNWSKPLIGRVSGNNIVQPDARETASVILDHWAKDQSERFKLFRFERQGNEPGLSLHYSADGTNWGPVVRWFGPAPAGSTVFYNPMRQAWVFSLADPEPPAKRRYWEVKDLVSGALWGDLKNAPLWVGVDKFDLPDPAIKAPPELVQLDATPYESLLVGLFTIGKGRFAQEPDRPPHNEIYLGYSRDGFHWFRPDRRPFISLGASRDDFNWGDVRPVGGGFTIVGRRLNFLFSGKTRDPSGKRLIGATGMASIRRDGFASIDAGPTEGILVTRPVKFTYAGYMLINMKTNAPDGEIRVAIVSTNGNYFDVTNNDTGETAAFTKENCLPVRTDSTLNSVNWHKIPHIGMLMNRPVHFVFYIRNASLYSFWISRSRRGRSEGFAAGGGMHYLEPTDTIGNTSYRSPAYRPRHLRPQTTTNGVPIRPTPLLPAPEKKEPKEK